MSDAICKTVTAYNLYAIVVHLNATGTRMSLIDHQLEEWVIPSSEGGEF